jgi:hypothetical protein
MWITSDGGVSWSEIAPGTAGHWPPQPYHSADGHWYIGTDTGLLRSADGAQWSLVPNFPGHSYVNATIGNGQTMWASDFGTLQAFNPAGVGNPYYQSAESDGLTWVPAPFTDPPGVVRTQGAVAFAYDRTYNVLYTTNGTQGAWRVVVR